MSKLTLQVVASVRDQATGKLNKIEEALKKSSGAADRTAVHFSHLNKTFAKATGSIIAFTNAYRNMLSTMSGKLPNIKIPTIKTPEAATNGKPMAMPSSSREPREKLSKQQKELMKFQALAAKQNAASLQGLDKQTYDKLIANKKSLEMLNKQSQDAMRKQDSETYKRVVAPTKLEPAANKPVTKEAPQEKLANKKTKDQDYFRTIAQRQNQQAFKPTVDTDKTKIAPAFQKGGKAIQQAGQDLTKFNQILFTTTAFVGVFAGAMFGLGAAAEEGAQLERVIKNFERVFGPSGELFKSIKGFTDASVDKLETLKAGLELSSLGIVTDSKTLARTFAMVGAQSRRMGISSAEGIKHFSSFLKDGNISHAQFLGLIEQSNGGLKTTQAIISKYAGVLSGAMGTSAKFAIVQKLLNEKTKDIMLGFRDLADVIADLKQDMSFLKNEVGVLVGEALKPFLEFIDEGAVKLREMLRHVRESADKGFLFLTKTVLVTTSAITGFIAVVGTTRLALKGLGALGIGIPGVSFALAALGVIFTIVTGKVDTFDKQLEDSAIGRFLQKLQIFGAALKGVFQLVDSFFDPDNFKAGIGKMDKSLFLFLEKYGLMTRKVGEDGKVEFGGLVYRAAQATALIANFFQSMFTKVTNILTKIANFFDVVGEKTKSIFKFTGHLIPRSWLGEGSQLYSKLTSIATVVTLVASTMAIMGKSTGLVNFIRKIPVIGTMFDTGMNMFSKIPVIGKLFGGTQVGPKGTNSDPIYTRSADKNILNKVDLITKLPNLKDALKLDSLKGILTAPLFPTITPWINRFISSISTTFPRLGMFSSAITGSLESIMGLSVISTITNIITKGIPIFGNMFAMIFITKSLFGGLKGIITTVIEKFDTFEILFDYLKLIIPIAFEEFKDSIIGIAKEIKNTGTMLYEGFVKGKDILLAGFDLVVQGMKDWIKEKIPLGDKIIGGIETVGKVKDKTVGVLKGLKDTVVNAVVEKASDLFTYATGNTPTETLNSLGLVGKEVGNAVVNTVTSPGETMANSMAAGTAAVVDNLRNGTTTAIQTQGAADSLGIRSSNLTVKDQAYQKMSNAEQTLTTTDARKAYLEGLMEQMSNQKQGKSAGAVSKGINAALGTDGDITQSEFFAVIKSAMQGALDGSLLTEKADETAKNTKKERPSPDNTNRGHC